MIRKLRHTIISLLAVIMLPAIATAQDDVFTIPTGTPENPLLDVKYRIDMEPFIFEPSGRHELAFRTFICYTATYADGTVEEKRERMLNYVALNAGFSFPTWGASEYLVKPEWTRTLDEEEKLCWLGTSVGEMLLNNCSLDSFWGDLEQAEAFFTAFRNLDRWRESIIPINGSETLGYDDITFVEYRDQNWPQGEYVNPNYSLYTTYTGYRIFKSPGPREDGGNNYNMMRIDPSFAMMWPVVVINDGNNTVVTCSPIQLTKADISLTSLGTRYGYMDTIKFKVTMELKYEDYTYRFETENLTHIVYPTDERLKAAARAAGYTVP